MRVWASAIYIYTTLNRFRLCRLKFLTSVEEQMHLTISGHHVAVTPALHSYVRGKLERVRRHFDHVIDVNVVLSVDKLRQKVEVTVRVSGKDMYAETDDGDLYAAIDLVADKLDRQILRHKDRLRAHSRHALKHQPAEGPAAAS